jgi:DNA (cytosine-5)-methyltransferase 1
VHAFLVKYYGTALGQSLASPLHTITSKARFGLVTVHGQQHAIADIGYRMLVPRELFNAQGFPPDFVIDPEFEGAPLTKTAQIELVGNSVSPPVAREIVAANCGRGLQAVA